MKGWLGARVDEATADFIELAILVEEAWPFGRSASCLRGDDLPPAKPIPPPSPRVQTDAKVAR